MQTALLVLVLLMASVIGVWATRPAPSPPLNARAAEARVNVNAANRAMLQLLPGIGPRLADQIVATREAEGPFPDLASLQRVKYVGPVTIERITPYAVAGPASNGATAPADFSSGAVHDTRPPAPLDEGQAP